MATIKSWFAFLFGGQSQQGTPSSQQAPPPPGRPEFSISSVFAQVPPESTNPEAPPDYVIVPPGHKIVVFQASDAAGLGKAESGIWIAQMGKHQPDRRVLDSLKNLATEPGPNLVIWILAAEFLEALSNQAGFVSEVAAIVTASRDRTHHSIVFPHALPQDQSILRQLRVLGVSLYTAAKDGECFVEVHRPDGIVVGMPGSPCQ